MSDEMNSANAMKKAAADDDELPSKDAVHSEKNDGIAAPTTAAAETPSNNKRRGRNVAASKKPRRANKKRSASKTRSTDADVGERHDDDKLSSSSSRGSNSDKNVSRELAGATTESAAAAAVDDDDDDNDDSTKVSTTSSHSGVPADDDDANEKGDAPPALSTLSFGGPAATAAVAEQDKNDRVAMKDDDVKVKKEKEEDASRKKADVSMTESSSSSSASTGNDDNSPFTIIPVDEVKTLVRGDSCDKTLTPPWSVPVIGVIIVCKAVLEIKGLSSSLMNLVEKRYARVVYGARDESTLRIVSDIDDTSKEGTATRREDLECLNTWQLNAPALFEVNVGSIPVRVRTVKPGALKTIRKRLKPMQDVFVFTPSLDTNRKTRDSGNAYAQQPMLVVYANDERDATTMVAAYRDVRKAAAERRDMDDSIIPVYALTRTLKGMTSAEAAREGRRVEAELII